MRCSFALKTGLLAALLLGAKSATAEDTSFALQQKGKELVNAGDCVACHTQDKARPFAGGRAIPTPFGTIYSANITPDRDAGIGAWTEEDFYRAMHEGRGPHGEFLYPAFPYPYFTRLTRDDVNAIRAYLMTLDPIPDAPPRNELTWPLNFRTLMFGWNELFFSPGTYRSNPDKSPEWNRGAYLVEGAGHCGACHTPKNTLGADKNDKALRGAQIQNWTAPALVGNDRDGLGRWSKDDIAEYLKTGRNRFTGATGLMAEVVINSTSKLPDGDLDAIATYLKDLHSGPEQAASAPADVAMQAGKAIYDDVCSACHQANGEGVPHMFPSLKGSAAGQQADASTVLRVILDGAITATTDKQPTPSAMPAFAWKLNDNEVAAVATYVRNAWGNRAAPVSADDVRKMRGAIDTEKAAVETRGTKNKRDVRAQN